MLAASRQLAIRNRILAALPDEEFTRLQPHLKNVRLNKGEVIYLSGDNIQYSYFPDSGLLSLLSVTETGATIEVAAVGNEGVVGLPVILRNRIMHYEVNVQFTTEAFKIRAEALQEEFDKGQALHEFCLRYLNLMIRLISQSSICNRFHNLEETLSRWLLIVQDRMNSDRLNLTHEVISQALGVPRTAVTGAAGVLQGKGLISYSRGRILILDRAGLEVNSCECYRIIHESLATF